MSLTVGTPLQNGKFVIKAILHQSDFGVTYQAAYSLINHPLILQSFNEAVRQRSDFEPLRQKFLQEVLLSSQPSEIVSVIDCFEENGMPFVILAASEQSIPRLGDWFEIPLETSVSEMTQPTTQASTLKAALATAFPETPSQEVSSAVPIASASTEQTRTEKIERTEETAIANAEPVAFAPTEVRVAPPSVLKSFPLSNQATNGSTKGVTVLISEQSLKPKKWMPLALMMTALIAGFGGVGLGLALRFKPTPQGNTPSTINSGWFGREQSFPPQQEWPITETPNLYPPSSAFEQPLDQPSPVVRGSSIPTVQPTTGYTPPPGYVPPTGYTPPAQLIPPNYEPAPPGIADYPPPTSDPAPPIEPVAPAVDSLPPEAIQPLIPLPEPVTPQVPIETLPEVNKPPAASPKNVFD